LAIRLNLVIVHIYKKKASRKRLLLPIELDKQNPACYVCSRPYLVLRINTLISTLGDLVNLVLRGTLGMLEPTVMVESDIIFESGEDVEPEFVARQSKKLLKDCKVGHNTVLIAEDFLQDLSLQITINQSEDFDIKNDVQPFEIIGNIPAPPPAAKSATTTKDDDDDVEMVFFQESTPKLGPTTTTATTTTTTSRKRKSHPSEEENHSEKNGDQDFMLIE